VPLCLLLRIFIHLLFIVGKKYEPEAVQYPSKARFSLNKWMGIRIKVMQIRKPGAHGW
jgi:hypothetical protein